MALGKTHLEKNITHAEAIEYISSTAESAQRKKKESVIHMGATIFESDMDHIKEVMEMLGTTNLSEAVRFLLLAAWTVYGKEIHAQASKRKRIPKVDLKGKIPSYYRTDFKKTLQRINKKVVDEIVNEMIEEDKRSGYPDRVIILDAEKVLAF